MTVYDNYNNFTEFISTLKPEEILSLKANEKTQKRLYELVYKTKNEGLSQNEQEELSTLIRYERIMRLAKLNTKLKE
jgi:hypothetical protein